jgi:hypothetical protein
MGDTPYSIINSLLATVFRGPMRAIQGVSLTWSSATKTVTGPKVHCELDANANPKGIAVSDEGMNALSITGDDFHGGWNYTTRPSRDQIAR